MKRFQKSIVLGVAMASVFALSACAHETNRVNPTERVVVYEHAMSAQTMQLPVGETFTVRLASNPSTGYNWTLVENIGDALKQGQRTFESANKEGAVGAGGVDVWQFEAVKKGQQTLRLEYRRPWEKDVAAIYEAVYHVTVK